jgi:hypothetical protein
MVHAERMNTEIFTTHRKKTTAPTAALEWTVTAMTRKDKLLEARAAISDGMERTAVHRDIWQNELVWWLCKAVLLLIEKEVKK